MEGSVIMSNYNDYGRRFFINKYNYNDLNKLLKIKHVEVGVLLEKASLADLTQVSITANFLYNLVGVVPQVEDLGAGANARGLDPEHRVRCSTKLVKDRQAWFLDYLVYIVIPIYEKRYGKRLRFKTNRQNYTLMFNDLNVFFNLKDEYGFDNKVYVTIAFEGEPKMSKDMLDIIGIDLV